MNSLSIACVLLIGSLVGCGPKETNLSGTFPFGRGEEIADAVIERVLKGYETEYGAVGWSGGGGGDEFAYDATLLIKKATLKEVSTRLGAAINELPEKFALSYTGESRSGSHEAYSHINIRYEEDGDLYFFDFLLNPYEEDEQHAGGVELIILHKGVRR